MESEVVGGTPALVPLALYLLVGVRDSEQIFVDLMVYDVPINSLPLMKEVARDWRDRGRDNILQGIALHFKDFSTSSK